MTFSRIRAPGAWSDGSTVSDDEFEAIDENLSNALDGANGGTYAPTAVIEIGGQGLTSPQIQANALNIKKRIIGDWRTYDVHASTGATIVHYSSYHQLFVAVLDTPDLPVALTSRDGIRWNDIIPAMETYTGGAGTFTSIAESPAGVLVVGTDPNTNTNTKVYFSTDGAAWSLCTAFGTSNTVGVLVAWVPPLNAFVALEDGTTNVFTSTDGDTWTAAPSVSNITFSFSFGRYPVASSQALYLTGQGGSSNNLHRSTNGTTWTSVLSGSNLYMPVYDAVRDRICVFNGTTVYVATSAAGTSFTSYTIPTMPGVSSFTLLAVRDGVFVYSANDSRAGAGLFVTVEADGDLVGVCTGVGALKYMAWGEEPRRLVGAQTSSPDENFISTPF